MMTAERFLFEYAFIAVQAGFFEKTHSLIRHAELICKLAKSLSNEPLLAIF